MGAKLTVSGVNAAYSQRWAYNTQMNSVQYFSFLAPLGSTGQQCGKVVFSDLHVSAGSGSMTDDVSSPMYPFPSGCRTGDLSPQEKALLFMLFDLSSCVLQIG